MEDEGKWTEEIRRQPEEQNSSSKGRERRRGYAGIRTGRNLLLMLEVYGMTTLGCK
jgi:hypothetical protein